MQYYIPYQKEQDMHSFGKPQVLYAGKLDHFSLSHPRIVHSHNDIIEFIYILSGHGHFEIDGISYPVTSGDLVIYNSGALHYEFNNETPLPIIFCAATDIQLPGMEPNCIVPAQISPVFHLEQKAAFFRDLMQSLFEASSEDSPHKSAICQSLFLTLFYYSLNLIDQSTPSKESFTNQESQAAKWVSMIRDYIDEHITEDLMISQLAEQFGISESYLTRIFNQTIGCSPSNYMINRRIGNAQTLLLNTDLSIAEVAKEVGFQDQSYFTKRFAKCVGITPHRYRKRYRGTTKQVKRQ